MEIIAHPQSQKVPSINDPMLLSLERYWQTLRSAKRLPARSDLNPSQIDHVLPNAFILQRVAPGTARFRVAGQKLHDLTKMDARGMPFSTLFQTSERDDIRGLVEVAFCEPAIVGVPLVSPATALRPALHAAMLLLPMRDDQNQTNRILGAIVTEPHTATRPQRFSINAQGESRHETLGVKLAVSRLRPRDPAATTEKPDTTLRPALRLVVNNG